MDSSGAQDEAVTVKKLNVETGDMVTIAEYPMGALSHCDIMTGTPDAQFQGQLERSLFSKDYKRAIDPMWGTVKRIGEVAYFDLAKGQRISINDVIPHATGDFAPPSPSFSNGYFTDDDLIGFHDDSSHRWKYFDTNKLAVVRESSEREPAGIDSPMGSAKLPWDGCKGLWVIDSTRYIRTYFDENYVNRGPNIVSMPRSTEPSNACGDLIQPFLPEHAKIELKQPFTSDPVDGSVYMLVEGSDGLTKFYKANLADPNQPTKIELKDPRALVHSGIIMAWE